MLTSQEVLARVPLFSMLSKKDVSGLARQARDRTFPAGTVVTGEKDTGISFGVIAEGQASVNIHDRAVRTLGPGDYFGEMALIDRSVRSAEIVATTDLHCLMFTGWVFRPFAMQHPETAWALLEAMVQRVRDAENR